MGFVSFCDRRLVFLLSLLLITNFPAPTYSSHILFYIVMGSHSHRTSIEPLAHKLVAAGHNVTFLTPIKPTMKNPKFNEFSPLRLTQYYDSIMDGFADQYFTQRLQSKYANDGLNPPFLAGLVALGCDLVFNSPEFKPWLATLGHVDLIIADGGCNKCAYGLGFKFKSPMILTLPLGFMAHEEDQYGTPLDISWLPTYAANNVFTRDRTFFDKFYVTLYRLYSLFYTNWIALPKIDELVRTVLETPDMPSITELEKETSLIFVNQHFSNDYARSLPPYVIQIGGMHCTEGSDDNLSQELKEFIDGAGDDGFVFISFGTIVTMSKVPIDLVNFLFDTVGKMKTRFLWKWDGQTPKNLPKNVLTANWFPQQDLLASKSIRAFVTHGGQMSTQQGVCHGVPMIVIPITFDQPYNAQTVAVHEIGIHLELSEMKEKFGNALNAILNDEKYQTNSKLVSQRFKDRPLSSLDTAFYWTNYVLRHRNVSHLRPVGNLRQTWWQRRLLDV